MSSLGTSLLGGWTSLFSTSFTYHRVGDGAPTDEMELKESVQSSVDSPAVSLGSQDHTGRLYNDQEDMLRLGKKQEVPRNFRFFATLGFVAVFVSSWEFVLVSTWGGLLNGGFGGLIWEYLWTFCLYSTVVVSLAEMSSMAPTAGGQYHWVSEFAPPWCQKFLSYMAGWTSIVAWQPALAGGLYPIIVILETMIVYWNEDFAFTRWQQSLLMIAFGFLTIPFNTFWRRFLPMFEIIVLVLHFAGFFATILPLWILAPKNSASEVFTEVVNSGGWSNTGLSLLIGQVTVLYCMAGFDSAVHLGKPHVLAFSHQNLASSCIEVPVNMRPQPKKLKTQLGTSRARWCGRSSSMAAWAS